MNASPIRSIRARYSRRSDRAAADYVYQAATVAAAILLLLTAAL
ncbi:hypothetical protein HNQ77_004267 [Silvibacterium bohemicum]|uniref:Uncharacterized protein n=1 Tax=Silvibacterium bohemicum TaxID=1577686 RepID=A0A841K029_9BACT|nr:hypothetical protein [Silvibacterium bohemicum]MBB6146295.1 hypothetical protein [Silvibacterium bohemicum]